MLSDWPPAQELPASSRLSLATAPLTTDYRILTTSPLPMPRLTSFFGLCVLIGLAWLLSSHKKRISLRLIVSGVLLQLVFALLVLKTAPGRAVFDRFNDGFHLLLSFVRAGSDFVFGDLLEKHPNIFAFSVLPSIIFFSALMSLLYHFGVMQRLVQAMAIIMQRTMGTS